MQYLGGKHFLGKALSEVMLSQTRNRARYIEPFVGAGGVLIHMAPHFRVSLASDYSLDLIMMWRALQDGWVPPEVLSEEEWQALRCSEPSALRAFAGFGCSFGGKWFAGYARPDSRRPEMTFAGAASRSLVKKIEFIKDSHVVFRRRSYKNISVRPNDVVYLDPHMKTLRDTGQLLSLTMMISGSRLSSGMIWELPSSSVSSKLQTRGSLSGSRTEGWPWLALPQ